MIISSQGLAPISTTNPPHPCAHSSITINRYRNGSQTFALTVTTRYVLDDLGLVSKTQTVRRSNDPDAIIGPEHEQDITGAGFNPEEQARRIAAGFNYTRGAA